MRTGTIRPPVVRRQAVPPPPHLTPDLPRDERHGWVYAQLGEHERALTACQQALSLSRPQGTVTARPAPGTASATFTTTAATWPRPSTATGRPLPSIATWATPAARAASSSTSATARTQRATPGRHRAARDGRWPSWRPSATPTPTRPAPGWQPLAPRDRHQPGEPVVWPAVSAVPGPSLPVARRRPARHPARLPDVSLTIRGASRPNGRRAAPPADSRRRTRAVRCPAARRSWRARRGQ
jgi:hypothetical protein